jgi:glycosyltransferase involved in cell wall biosynthesis
MTESLINILTRTANRPKEFKKCIASIKAQTYKDIRLIIATDSPDTSTGYILEGVKDVKHYKLLHVHKTGTPFNWNLYCNELKSLVEDGWFFYLDDDDFLVNKRCLALIETYLTNPERGVICQFMRAKRAKPSLMSIKNKEIIQGKIGGSCLFLHHSQKDIAHWDGNKAADFRWIKAVSEKIPLKFVPIVVVKAGNNGRHGQ